MIQAITEFFNSENFMPHGHCFLWQPDILWLHVLSDTAIVAAYFSIPFALLYFIWKRKDMPFQSVFLLFGAFILLCGTTHLMGIWVLWHPDYAAEGIFKALTAITSVATFFVIVKLIPQALLIPGPSQLAAVNQELRDANDKLALLYEQSKESSQSHLRAVVDNALDGLIAINEQGIVESFNPACERIFGYNANEVIGNNIKMLMPEPYHSEHDGYLHHYVETGNAKIIGTAGREVSAKRKNGSVFPMDLSVSAFQLKDGRHFSGIIRDITARKEAEQELKDNANRLNAVFDTVLDGLITINSHAIVQSFNAAAERIFGYKAEEVIGQNVKMLMPEPYHSEHDGYVGNYLKTGKAKIIGIGREVSAKRKDGSTFPMELGISNFTVGKETAFVGIIRDITARKEAEEKNALLAAVVASSDDAIISKTLDGIITSWNTGAEKLFGYSAAEAIGEHINILIPPERMGEEEQIVEQLHIGTQVHQLETVRIHKNGQPLDISLTVSPVREAAGRIIGASKILRDITAQKKVAAELLRYNAALERSNKELDDFAYIASHDLKEPLRGLFNNAKFLEKDYKDKIDAPGVERLQRLGYLTQRMEQLVNDLLYFSRLGRQDLAIVQTDLNMVIRDIESMMETTLKEQNAVITIPKALPEIICDKTRVTEIFRNLITNAVKYNDQEKKIIEIGTLDEIKTKNGIEKQAFYVRDNGIGIEEEFHEEIFRIFKRLNEEDDEKKGTGVGLTFVRKIIERHGGRIWLESMPGKGTTFYFTLNQGVAYAAAA